jgi:flagellar motor protein MotB
LRPIDDDHNFELDCIINTSKDPFSLSLSFFVTMSTPIEALLPAAAALAAQAAAALPVRKRKLEEDEQPDAGKALKTEAAAPAAAAAEAAMKPAAAVTQEVVVKQRGVRLEQNRKVRLRLYTIRCAYLLRLFHCDNASRSRFLPFF